MYRVLFGSSVEIVPLPVPLLEAFALPDNVRTSNAKPTPIVYIIPPCWRGIVVCGGTVPRVKRTMPKEMSINIPWASIVAMFKTLSESCEVSSSHEQASDKRFPNIAALLVVALCFPALRHEQCRRRSSAQAFAACFRAAACNGMTRHGCTHSGSMKNQLQNS